jgi:tetrahydromethanopterin S-methyltransferase subunit D
MTNANTNTATIPAAATVAYAIGTAIEVRQAGAGQTTIVAASGVTINTSETLKIRKQHASVSLIKVAADEWDLAGDTVAA